MVSLREVKRGCRTDATRTAEVRKKVARFLVMPRTVRVPFPSGRAVIDFSRGITMTRREWLQAVGGSVVAPTARPGSRLPLGFSLYGMKSLKLVEAVRVCGAIRYDGIELAAMPGYPAEPKELDGQARKDLRKQL